MTSGSVLIVSPIASHPADQGNAARIRAEADELRRRGVATDFFYYGMEGLSQEQFEAMSRYWRRFFFLKSLALAPPALPHAWGLDDWCSDHLCEQVAAIVARHRYDAVIVNYVWMSKIFERISGPLKILDTHDLFGDRAKVAERARLEPRWFFTTLAEEDRGFARADVVIGIQEAESAKIAARHNGRTITVGHPIDPHFMLRAGKRPPPSFTFGYIGSGNPFNLASIAALDLAIAERGGIDWALAGSITRNRLDLKSHPYRMGMVDKLTDFYDHVGCVLNPMIGGTGLKIKTIEALAYGRPIIGTVDAFEGIPARHPLHQLEAMEDMAAALRDYQESAKLRDEMQKESYRVFALYMARVSREYDLLADIIRQGGRARRLSGAA
ncbi:hypothetical protein [Terrarubrum flagellatum]|uniref:hypothetical protein n=1 Tax=Terrirubrum flagellatum TaxID=2895980 RepID=UPI003144FCBF